MFRRTLWFIIIDIIASLISWLLFYIARKVILDEAIVFQTKAFISGLTLSGVWVSLFIVTGRYKNLYHKSRISEVFESSKTIIFTSVILFFVILLDDEGITHYQDYYPVFFSFLGIHLIVFILFKTVSLSYAKTLVRKNKVQFNTLIIGSNERSLDFIQKINNVKKDLGLNFIGYIHLHENSESTLKENLRHWGGVEQLRTVIRRCNVSQIIISLDPSEHEKITYLLSIINTNEIKVSIIPETYHLLLGSVGVNHILGVPLIDIKQEIMPLWQRITKRVLDVSISGLVLLLGAPFYLFFMLLTKLSSKGPIFYHQLRVGKNEKPFKIYKFRSMYVGSENAGPSLSSDNDKRITPWGKVMRKLRIDELPQFFNVLIGDMSLVGTRPEREYFIEKIVEKAPHYKRLLQLRPGITSLGQVKFGYAENVDEMVRRLEYDIAYLDNISLVMDLRIMLATIMVVIQGRGK